MRNKSFIISHYQVTPSEFSIQADGLDKQSLQPKFIEVLVYLAENYGRVVPREELINHIWGEDSFVGEKSLTNAIWHLRKKLTSEEGEEEIIKTIRKAGYQLIPAPTWQAIKSISNEISSPELVTSSVNYSIDSSFDGSLDSSIYQEKTTYSTSEKKRVNNTEDNKTKIKMRKTSSTLVLVSLIISLLVLLVIQQLSNDKNPRITSITNNPGSELFPSPSPDGRYVVYSQVLTNKATNLFMKDTHQIALPPKQLTFDNASEGHSVWSNDGQYLYFSRKDKTKRSCHYIQLKVASQQEKQIATCPMQGGYYYLDISPDDKTLAVYNKGALAKRSGIYFIDLLSKNHEMTRFSCDSDCSYKDRDMAFSPNGKYMAISRRTNRLSENIYLIDLVTKITEQLTFNEEDIVGMAWQGNSKKLVFAAQRADNRFGYVIDIASKVLDPLNLADFSYPSIAKKSKQLYYQKRKEKSSLASLQLNDSIASSPFPVLQSNYTYESADYSVINDLIVFSSNESGFDELWSAKPDGSARKQLTNLKQTIRYPKWSHDGQSVVFLAPLTEGSGEGNGIYIYSFKNERVTLLKSPFIRHRRPNWSFDDNAIISTIYGDKNTDIYSINIFDASTKRLTFDGARYGVMIAKDTLLYTKLVRGLWRKSVESKGQGENVIDGDYFNMLYAWTYSNGHIYYQQSFDDHYQLASFNLDNNIQTPLVRLPLNSMPRSDNISYLPANDSLLFTRTSYPQANIKMIAIDDLF
jgi:Tol biopolymer transport system component